MSIDAAGYANAFSEADTRIQLKNFEDDQASIIGDSSKAIQQRNNLQVFIDALKFHLSTITANPKNDHPTIEPTPPKHNPVISTMEGIGDAIVHPIEDALGSNDPLPPGAEHHDFAQGPNPAGAFWDAIMHTPPNPMAVIRAVWNVTVTTFDFIVWDFEEFVRLFRAWDGSAKMLLGHPQFLFDVMWRTLVTVGLVVGLAEIGPILLLLTEWTKAVVSVLLDIFGLGWKAIKGLIHLLERKQHD